MTKVSREFPVHPVRAATLAHSRNAGWKEAFGREPMPDGLIIPDDEAACGPHDADDRALRRALLAVVAWLEDCD